VESNNAEKLLAKANVLVSDDHFVYKSGRHGSGYLNKEMLVELSANEIVCLIEEIGRNAIANGFSPENRREIGIIGPAMGAIYMSLTLAAFFERVFVGCRFFPARTELVKVGSEKVHVIPEKLAGFYEGKQLVTIDDIVNGGTTIREIARLFKSLPGAEIFASMCIADRGGQTAETLGIDEHYPLLRVDMSQFSAKECPYCKDGVPVNTVLGKGNTFVEKFGQPPFGPHVVLPEPIDQ